MVLKSIWMSIESLILMNLIKQDVFEKTYKYCIEIITYCLETTLHVLIYVPILMMIF